MVLPEVKAKPRSSSRSSKALHPTRQRPITTRSCLTPCAPGAGTGDGDGKLPAYIIFPDRTLQELARVKPQSDAELLEVRGIGPAKARQFGKETLA